MGNPLTYIGRDVFGDVQTGTLEWNGRELRAVQLEDCRFEYEYNADGLRTTVREYNRLNELKQTSYYIWQNGKLMGYLVEDYNGDTEYVLKLLYDGSGESVGYEYIYAQENTTVTMFFQKNVQGDITGVIEDSGTPIVDYTYDAWGNVTAVVLDTDASDMFEGYLSLLLTPITYRGYMYDPYTGLYYLQSRYYNPTYGRFLNADTTDILEITQGTTHGANLFAYCNNNPVNYVDYTGEFLVGTTVVIGGTTISAFSMFLVLGVLVVIVIYFLNSQLFTEVSGGLSLDEVIERWRATLRFLLFRLIGGLSLFDVLADINSRIKGYKFRGGQQLHHIAPRKVFLNMGIGMVYCSQYVVEAGIDINSPFNTVWLSASFHSALNTNVYYSFVYSATKTAYESQLGVVGIYMVLLAMKIILSVFNSMYVTMNGGII